MGFHRRHIQNNQVIELFKEGGIDRVKDWYTRGCDALVTENGLASHIAGILELNMDEKDRWDLISNMITNKYINTV